MQKGRRKKPRLRDFRIPSGKSREKQGDESEKFSQGEFDDGALDERKRRVESGRLERWVLNRLL